jgi:UDP-glucuronate decarboxylase
MRVLVAGGAGFVGSHLCERLHGEGHEVLCVDNLFTGRLKNLRSLLGSNRYEFIEHDVTDMLDAKVDYICNLACPASPPTYQIDPIKTFETNILGTLNLLKLAERLGVPLLQASTSEVYGDPLHSPQVETDWGNVNPIGIRSCYDEGKRAAETLCADFRRTRNVDTKIIRIFNTYGPNMDPLDGRVVSNFLVQALQQEDITIYGDGSQTRSFCFVSDLVDGIRAMMDSDFGGPVNLGNPTEMTMIELAERVIELTKSSSKLVFKALPLDDPKQRRPDIGLAKAVLGWEPRVEFSEGLRRTADYFKQEIAVSL